jgi:hypothetical protein
MKRVGMFSKEIVASVGKKSVATAASELLDMSVTPSTKADYERHVANMKGLAREAKEPLTKAFFTRTMASWVENEYGGTSTANTIRSALAWDQKRRGLKNIWADDVDVRAQAKAFKYC